MTHAPTATSHTITAYDEAATVRRRNLWATVGLNLLTVGLYSVYWWYMTNRELRDLGRSLNEPELQREPVLSALAFFLGSLVVPLIWTAVTTSRRIRLAQDLVGTEGVLLVWAPVALLFATLPFGFVDGESGGTLAAAMAATLALKIAAVAYMQAALNEISETLGRPGEQPTEPMPVVRQPAPAQV